MRSARVLQTVGLSLLLGSVGGLCLERGAQAQRLLGGGEATSATSTQQSGASLRFEPNRGQFEDRVRYLARGMGYAVYLTRGGATLALSRSSAAQPKTNEPLAHRTAQLEQALVSMHVVGGRDVEPEGDTRLQGASNYFVGNDPASWKSDVENYASIRYEDVLPGVSVVYYGNAGRQLEYDLVLSPGANPNQVVLEFEGADAIRIDADGSAVLQLPGGVELRKPAPVAYQVDAAGTRFPVSSRYQLRGTHRLGFALGNYDRTRVLRIDPVLLYSTYLGGSSFDQAFGGATDPAGNTYLVGYTASTLFPTIAPLQPNLAGGVFDAFVCKINPQGGIVYATFLGGSGADEGYAIAADAAGNAYVTGVTFSTDFPTVAPFQASAGGKQDAFIAKLNPQGSALVYSSYLGGTQDDFAQGIAVGPSGNAYLAGTTFSANFPKLAALSATLRGTSDAFVTSFAAAGSSLVYSTYLGGSADEAGHGVAVDTSGNAFVVGSTSSSNFPLASPLQATFGGGALDAFVSKLNAAGSAFIYSTYLGGVFTDDALGVASNASGLATVVGYTTSTNFPHPNAIQPSLASAGQNDAFVSQLSASGNTLAFSSYLGGSGNDSASAVGMDAANNVYVVGSTDSSDFPLLKPITGQSAYHGATDGFVSALEASSSTLSYSSYLGGSDEDHAVGVGVQAIGGTTHVVGNTSSVNFPVALAPIATLVGAQDAFITRLPGVSTAVPASARWTFVLLGGFLLGAGLLVMSAQKKRWA